MEKKTITVRGVPADDHRDIRRIAAERSISEDRSVSMNDVLLEAVREYLVDKR